MRPERGGLYDPRTEHDACGVGFVAHIKGVQSPEILDDAITLLERMTHRGACGCDPDTGDGAGILTQLPHRFFKRIALAHDFDLPRRKRYGVGMVFLPQDPDQRRACEDAIEAVIREEDQRVVGWRDVPVNPTAVGPQARSNMPVIRQLYVGLRRVVPSAFERKLYIIRKVAENRIREEGLDPDGFFHVASLSTETIVYKGLLLAEQLRGFYPDLSEPDFQTAIALVHSRFSTNTLPTWDLAQPFRFVAHNGEINTLRGNANWTHARRSQLQSAKFEGKLDRLFPIVVPDKSDSAQFDNMLELLHLAGRSLPHAAMLMIPEAWENDLEMDVDRRAFYDYASSLMEPWDGPAAICFSDGRLIGATLDRNGLRPARFMITRDDRVICASEAGVVDIAPEDIVEKGRLQPGKIFVVDTVEGKVLSDDEVKREIVTRWPYRKWLDRNEFHLESIPKSSPEPAVVGASALDQQRLFGWTDEDLRVLLAPMAEDGKEPTGSMGDDAPLAVLSTKAPPLYNYFRQLFAQVTNPPIDPIREEMVMSLTTWIGQGGNTFDETPEQCHRVNVPSPVLTNEQLNRIVNIERGVFEAIRIPTLYTASSEKAAEEGLSEAVAELCRISMRAVDDGYNVIVLSDRGAGRNRIPIPSLLACAAVHNHFVKKGVRTQIGLVIESADVREVHHVACLLGFGAAAINPWLALDTIGSMSAEGLINVDADTAEKNYCKSINKGLLKIMSKMGISTIHSYRGGQIFEAVGLKKELADRYFGGVSSRIEGVGLAELGREAWIRHQRAFGPQREFEWEDLPAGGVYQWRRRGEQHKWNPTTVAKLQGATRLNDESMWREYSDAVNNEDRALTTIRGLLRFDIDPSCEIAIEEVESVESIMSRFCTGAMSFGSISAEAHETLAIAMNRIGGRSNTGEGGEEQHRWTPDENGDHRRSAIKQVASGRFGVHIEYLMNADELQIKVAQGAKPGEGGQLPGHKVSERIATVRCSTPGVTLISPPPHHDIYSIEDLAQLIIDLKTVNPAARISVKLVSEVGVGTIAAGVAKAHAECIIIAGETGGTGASPVSSIKRAGLPWELGLAETQQVMVQNGLRGRARLQVDGGLRTGRDVVIGALLGAEEFGFSTAPLIVSGCIMLRKCHLNTCSVGIATQNPELTERFTGDPDHVVNFFRFIAEDVRRLMARLGFRTVREMVGRADRLKQATDIKDWKARGIDLSRLLHVPDAAPDCARVHSEEQDFGLEGHMDHDLIKSCSPAFDGSTQVTLEHEIRNRDRTVGAMLSGALVNRRGGNDLPDDSIIVDFRGSAGQSFGAFLAKGITFRLVGESNDYVGKGLSGGCISVRTPSESTFAAEENIIVGNVVLYGATAGHAFFNGVAGERFCVRNSGANAVVEGVGDHGCEYMTGGNTVILGTTGRNFGAGMSGGIAWVYDIDGEFRSRCNHGMIELEDLDEDDDIKLVHSLISQHVEHTGSARGVSILENWQDELGRFVKVMPTEYRRVLQERAARQSLKDSAE